MGDIGSFSFPNAFKAKNQWIILVILDLEMTPSVKFEEEFAQK